jgi:hypothetical protein
VGNPFCQLGESSVLDVIVIDSVRKIPTKLRDDMSNDPYMKQCCFDGNHWGHVEWHHNLIYSGRQVNEAFCILPLCQLHHRDADNKETREKLNWIMWNRATEEQLTRFSKAENYKETLARLNNKYGEYKQ